MDKTHSNKVCPVERSGALEIPLRRLIQNPTKILKPYLKAGDKVLDFGCGPGFFTFDIAQLVGESGLVYAADLQEGMLERVRNKIALRNMQHRIKVHKCDESAINLNDTVDFILAFYMIHELDNQEITFQEFKRILKPDGKILIIEPNFHVSKEKFNDMILKLEKADLKIAQRPGFFFSRAVLVLNDNKSTNT
jgi:ubiquinone/menaquinone biosynthesis C-methylase UbiE